MFDSSSDQPQPGPNNAGNPETADAQGHWVLLGRADDFPEGSLSPATVEGRALMVCRLDGRFHAWADYCPHAGRPLHDGAMHEGRVICRHHGNTYCLATGRNVDDPRNEPPLKRYKIEQRGDELWVFLHAMFSAT